MAQIYDFLWDDQGDLGVWVALSDGKLALVEAMVCDPPEAHDGNPEPTGDYVLASAIELQPGDGVWVNGKGDPVYGFAAQAALAKLQGIERDYKQVAVNEQQEALGIAPAE